MWGNGQFSAEFSSSSTQFPGKPLLSGWVVFIKERPSGSASLPDSCSTASCCLIAAPAVAWNLKDKWSHIEKSMADIWIMVCHTLQLLSESNWLYVMHLVRDTNKSIFFFVVVFVDWNSGIVAFLKLNVEKTKSLKTAISWGIRTFGLSLYLVLCVLFFLHQVYQLIYSKYGKHTSPPVFFFFIQFMKKNTNSSTHFSNSHFQVSPAVNVSWGVWNKQQERGGDEDSTKCHHFKSVVTQMGEDPISNFIDSCNVPLSLKQACSMGGKLCDRPASPVAASIITDDMPHHTTACGED